MDQPLANSLYSQNSGLTSSSPFIEIFTTRDPTSNDVNYPIQKRWFNTTDDREWLLIGFTSFNGLLQATWINFSTNAANEFITNSGTAIPVLGVINDLGTGSITTTGSGNTITTSLTGLTNHSVLVGAGTDTITKLAVGTNGQVLIGATAADPAFGTLTSSDGSITFTTGVNTLSLQVTGGTTVGKTITGDTGGELSPTDGNWNIIAGISTENCGATVKFIGLGSTLTLNVTDASNNTIIGNLSGRLAYSGSTNTVLGSGTMTAMTSAGNSTVIGALSATALTTSSSNVIVGNQCAILLATGSGGNVFLGAQVAASLVTGSSNICIGKFAASNYTSSESSNIIIGNNGIIADSNKIRLGTIGQQTQCYIAGIGSVPISSNQQFVVIDTVTGQLGSTPFEIPVSDPSEGNIGLTRNSSTSLTINSASGAAFNTPSNNLGYVILPSFVTATLGSFKIYTVSSNITVTQANIGNNLFGLQTGISYQDKFGNPTAMPFFIYAVSNFGSVSPETAVSFFLSRMPNVTISPVAGKIGKSGTLLASTQGSFFAMDSTVTVGDYASSPATCIGSVRVNYTGSAWTFYAISSTDGIGMYQEGVSFSVPAGQFTASSGSFFFANGGTAPVFSTAPGGGNLYFNRDNSIRVDLALGNPTASGGGNGSPGVGAVQLSYAAPFVFTGAAYGVFQGLYQAGSTNIVGVDTGTPSTNYVIFPYTGNYLLNSDFATLGNNLNLYCILPIVYS